MELWIIGSTNDPKCGVAKYIREMIEQLNRYNLFPLTYNLDLRNGCIKYIIDAIRILTSIKNRPSIVHLQYTPTTLGPLITVIVFLLKRDGLKLIITLHEKPEGYLRRIKLGLLKRIFLLFERSLINKCDIVIVHTEEHKNLISKYYKEVSKKVLIIEHNIPQRRKSEIIGATSELGNELQLLKNKKIIGFFGTFRPSKGIDILVKAFAEISYNENLALLLAGRVRKTDKKYYSEILNLIKKFKIEDKVKIILDVPDEDISELLQTMDIITLPYLECTQSGVLFREIIPHMKPVVMSDVGGLGEAARAYGIGVVVQPGNPQALADAILELLRNDDLRKKIILNQEKFCELMNQSKTPNGYANLYMELLSPKAQNS
ncbi:TPA: glycosyltransferase [Candidatus Poribacteria bacterium]|nr:glycosyltransferase [Candidatus Poribacteria bacterium]